MKNVAKRSKQAIACPQTPVKGDWPEKNADSLTHLRATAAGRRRPQNREALLPPSFPSPEDSSRSTIHNSKTAA